MIYVDGTECLTTDGYPINTSFYDADGEEIIFMKYLDDKYGETYVKVTFLEQKITFTSQSYIYTRKMLIKDF